MIQVINKNKVLEKIEEIGADKTKFAEMLDGFYSQISDINKETGIIPPPMILDLLNVRFCFSFFDGSFSAGLLIYKFEGIAE